ncbi:MAG: glycosyltransferase family 9 protein [Verrucomicrobiota bacterium]
MNILAIKPDHLGDFALALPVLWELQQMASEDGRLDVMVSPPNAEWSAILDWLPNLIPIWHPRYFRPRKKFAPIASSKILAQAFALQKNRYDFGVELTSSENDALDKFIFIAAGVKWSSGPQGAHSFLLNEKHALQMTHQTKILAARCPEKLEIIGETDPAQFMPPEMRWRGKNAGEFILLSPWAGTTAKEWPHWKKLTQKLDNWKILAPPDRMTEARNLCEGIDDRLAPTRSIRETLEWLCNTKFVVTVDSATAHFAWLTGTPIVQIFSGTTESQRWASLASGVRLEKLPSCSPCHLEQCNQQEHFCMDGISVNDVLDAIQKL